MNFVNEILLSVEKIEVESLNKKVPEIKTAIDGYKQEMLEYIEEIYTKFSRRPSSNALLLTKANNLANKLAELDRVVSDIKNKEVAEVKNQIQIYKQQLVDAKYALSLASNLIYVHEAILKLKGCLQHKQYAEGIKLIQEIEHSRNDSEMMQLDSFNGLINKFVITKESLIFELIKEYKECIQFHKGETLVFAIKEKTNIQEIITAIGFSNLDLIDEVVSFLWEDVFNVIVNSKTNINITEEDNVTKLVINVVDKFKKDDYKGVFRNICLVAEFLQKHLNYELQDKVSMVDYIGSQFRENLAELLVGNCLSDTIPSNIDELQKYKVVLEETIHLQNELVKYGLFIEDENSRIIKYVKNVDVLYIDKKCQQYMATAMEIIKRDLHDMVEAGAQTVEETTVLSSNIFPRCFISKSAVDLVELADKIMQNAISSKINSEKLYSTVQNIFHMYGTEVQIHHQKLLQTIPQQVALFHNNCMYLSHKLSTWTETYQNQLAQYAEPVLFMEKAHLLKHIGNEAFVNTLKQQIKQIEDIMKNSGLSSVNSLEKLEPVTEKSIRQCLRQQELLRTVWHKVLSHLDYNRSIGCILNFLCNFIINEILKIEDISSEPGEQLVEIFKVILARGPKLFTDPKDIHLYVKSWYKFNELVFILSSSLIDICDRWAEGKGPLALQFKPEEVQKLIKAIFQNTDRRAAILAKIVK